MLWEQDGLSQRELCARVGMMEPTTVIALRGMEKAGLIRRVRGTKDKRVTRVHLTPKARRLRDRLLQISQGVNDQGAEGIDAAALVSFAVIARMTENLDRMSVKGGDRYVPTSASYPRSFRVMRGLDPRIHEAMQRPRPYGCHPLRFIMGCRVKPGNDER